MPRYNVCENVADYAGGLAGVAVATKGSPAGAVAAVGIGIEVRRTVREACDAVSEGGGAPESEGRQENRNDSSGDFMEKWGPVFRGERPAPDM